MGLIIRRDTTEEVFRTYEVELDQDTLNDVIADYNDEIVEGHIDNIDLDKARSILFNNDPDGDIEYNFKHNVPGGNSYTYNYSLKDILQEWVDNSVWDNCIDEEYGDVLENNDYPYDMR